MTDSILCVEDDPDIGRLLVAILGDADYPADWVSDGQRARSCWQSASLVILDLMLPGVDGLTICSEIRAANSQIPIIMLTAKAGTQDVVRGLELGADDYITKPFETEILLARVRALLRRHRDAGHDVESATPVIHAGDLMVDIDDYRVAVAGESVSLTAKEFALLALFARNPGHAFSRGELLQKVWGPEFEGFDHTVNTHINRLRGKIERDVAEPRYIHTVWGVGYRFADGLSSPAVDEIGPS